MVLRVDVVIKGIEEVINHLKPTMTKDTTRKVFPVHTYFFSPYNLVIKRYFITLAKIENEELILQKTWKNVSTYEELNDVKEYLEKIIDELPTSLTNFYNSQFE